MDKEDNLLDKFNKIFVSPSNNQPPASIVVEPTVSTQQIFQTTNLLENLNVSSFKSEHVQCSKEKPKK